MSDFLQRISGLSAERLALLAAELKSRLERAETELSRRSEPIAVVGMSCRLPGAPDPAAYWRLLRDGVDAVVEVPAERWDVDALYHPDPDHPGTMVTRRGGFIEGVEDFDPWFFGISPREALSMDPQQRLLLEVAWEALEHAGIAPDRLDGSAAGVFLGLCNNDYFALRLEQPLEQIDSWYASGVAASMASGRIAYLLGLQGPALTVDTACSSSLVALHLACESLRSGESRMALAAGVSLILSPETMIGLSKSRILSTDGRCRTFDAAAAGIVRGEGCAVVVLKRLSDAQRDGDRVLAVIRASGTNQDGRSSGITAPNGAAQEALLRATLQRAGLAATDVDFIEAHGTGTTLGDPIEVRAIGAVYGARPADRPLHIGSVKTNFGHLEATAGLAGFVKAVLALQHGEIPPHLHLDERNPHVDWASLPISIPTTLQPWVPGAADGKRRAAVSSFGFSGTNAHVILEQAPAPVEGSSARPTHLLALSARTPASLRTLAVRYADLLADPAAPPFGDSCHTANTGRALSAHRLAVTAGDGAEAAAALREWAASGTAEGVRAGRAAGEAECEPVFLFTGQGAQGVGMCRELYETQPVFRAELERCAALLQPELDVPLLDVLYPPAGADGAARIDRTEYAQPALFAVEWALAALWRSWGVEPAAVMGHSLGEYVAAAVAGLLPLEQALPLVARRGRLMQSLPAGGGMAAVFAPLAEVEQAIAQHSRLAIAAINGDANIVISGAVDALDDVVAAFAARGVNARRLVVSHAFHSPLMDPVLDTFQASLDGITWGEAIVPVVSNLTGGLGGPEMATARYWRDHLRYPVRFADGLRALYNAGHRTFLEVGPHPTLAGLAAAALPDATTVHSLRRGRPEWAELLDAAGALHVRGLRINFEAVDAGHTFRTATVPTSPFERKRFWQGWTGKGRKQATDEDGTWEVAWQDAGAAAAAEPAVLADSVAPQAAALVERHGAADYQHGLPLLDALCSALIVRGLRTLGCTLESGQQLEADALRVQLGILPAHERLLRRMLEILAEDGVLRRDDVGWLVVASPQDESPEALAAALLARAPGMRNETTLTLRCGLALADVLRGAADPLELLFPGGSTDEAAALYAESPSFRVFNALVRDTVAEALAAAGHGPFRVLEVGGGTGGVTRELLPVLPADRVHYDFTDVSPLFTARATELFGDHAGFRAAVLDLSHDGAGQGFEAGTYDLVVASNVLHATPDLRETLANIRTLLAPGGLLVALEGVLPQRFGDLTVGLTPGWWSYTDTDLRSYALLGPDAWLELLAECGFDAASALPDVPASAGGVLAQQRVLVARRPAAAGRWLAIGSGAASQQAVQQLAAAGLDVHAGAAADAAGCDGVLFLGALDAPGVLDVAEVDAAAGADMLAALEAPVMALLDTVRALAELGGRRLVIVTRAAEAAVSGEAVHAAGSVFRGLARAVALEHPELHCASVDLDPAGGAQALPAALARLGSEDQAAVRDGRLLVPRVVQAAARPTDKPLRFDGGACLITGGLAGVGLAVARWAAARGAAVLVLTGRNTPSAEARQVIDRIEAGGTRVVVQQGDVGRLEDVQAMVDSAGDTPLRCVFHSAGVTDDAALLAMDWDRMRAVMHAKVAGAWNLHRATARLPLDHFVLFSSGAGMFGSPGQANHAAANAFLAGLAQQRTAQGLPALCIDWGPWAETGAATRGGVLERARAAGLQPIATDAGLAALERLMTAGATRVAVMPLDWSIYLAHLPGGMTRPYFERVRAGTGATPAAVEEHAPPADEVTADVRSAAALAVRVETAVPGRRRDVLLDGVRDIAARVLGAAAEEIDPEIPLTEMGLDSLMAVEMRNRLAAALGTALPATLLYNYPTLNALADHLVRGYLDDAAEAEPETELIAAGRPSELDLDDLTEDEVADLLAERLKDV